PMDDIFCGTSIFVTGASGFVGKSVLFNQIRRNFPKRLRKVVVVEGDITEDYFGMSYKNLIRVLEETSVVFHCAAAVRFNERLKKAANHNMSGVRRMIKLCHWMPNLKAFLHCATAYVNADKPGQKIAEKLSETKLDAHKL
ncbi:hypothetical protein PMAYCL1PPCAC_14059, partial [Pristionchus mayeri]